jgi:hypothetical protein
MTGSGDHHDEYFHSGSAKIGYWQLWRQPERHAAD